MGVAIPYIIVALTAASAVTAAKNQKKQAKASAKASEFNADLATKQGAQQEALIRRQARRRLATMETSISKSGVTREGSPLMALAESASAFEADALNARKGAANTATLDRMRAKNAIDQGNMGAAASLISGASATAGAVGTGFGLGV